MVSNFKRVWIWLVLMVTTCLGWAHDPKLSGIGIATLGGKTTIAVQVHLANLAGADLTSEIAKRLDLKLNGESYVPTNPSVRIDKVQGVAYWTATYPKPIINFEVGHRLFPEDPGSRTIVSVTQEGKEVSETILDASFPSLKSASQGTSPATLGIVGQFLRLGIFHIFTGPDHILFILGLVLMGGSLKALLKTVTAFTLAHSITLTVAATGLWVPPSRIIEPLIALSIVAVALENLRRKSKDGRDWRPIIAFSFGLIHGFGFAGGLTEAGLPQNALGWALVSFNLGVECAQASIVLLAVPLLANLAKHRPVISRRVIVLGSCAISLAGAYWFVDRLHATNESTAQASLIQIRIQDLRPSTARLWKPNLV